MVLRYPQQYPQIPPDARGRHGMPWAAYSDYFCGYLAFSGRYGTAWEVTLVPAAGLELAT